MRAQNDKVIEEAFKRIAESKHWRIIEGMRALLDDAVKYALELHHKKNLSGHLETGDSYGWALAYNSEMIDMKVTVGMNELEGGVAEELEWLALKDNVGYIGIVMAGLNPPHYYKLKYEEEIVYDTLDFTAGGFERYFKEI